MLCELVSYVRYHPGFFVYNKDGRLRVIFDTRVVNCVLHDPPKTRLPTACSATSIELESLPGEEIYFGGGDIENVNAVYRIAAPEIAKQFFTLPGIRAKYLGIDSIGDVETHPPGTERFSDPQVWDFAEWAASRDPGFAKVSSGAISATPWKTIQSKRWKFHENIMRTESRAVE